MNRSEYPFSVGFVKKNDFEFLFTKKVTIVIGENGSGKSTFLELIATGCGFNVNGGNANHVFGSDKRSPLSGFIRFSWLPKVTRGFFMRAESFFTFSQYIDTLAKDDRDVYKAYGGKSLTSHSHGESFLALFLNRFSENSIFIIDEPEAALSPIRQIAFINIIKNLEKKNCQLIIATHSPLIMAYPNAQLVELSADGSFSEVDFTETSHYKIMRDFYNNPKWFISKVLSDDI